MYTRYFGFSEKPFNVTPDPRFLFLTESHEEALASMVYGIQERKGFIAVTGEVGTGKTTLIHELMRRLDKRVKTVFIFHTRVTFQELLRRILRELELPLEEVDKGGMVDRLHDYLIECLACGENLALIIDEAQHLSTEVLEELRLLSNLETSASKLLQILLVGQPELKEKLDSRELRQLKQRIVAWRQIRPLSEEDARNYVEHRLRVAGSGASKIFTGEALALIAQNARGIPRNINVLCDNALLIGYGMEKKKIDGAVVEEVLGDMDMAAREESAPAPPSALAPPGLPGPPEPEAAEPIIGSVAPSSTPRRRRRTARTAQPLYAKMIIMALGAILVLLLLFRQYFDQPTQRRTGSPQGDQRPTALSASGAWPKAKGEIQKPGTPSDLPLKTPPETQAAVRPVEGAGHGDSGVKKVITVVRGQTIFALCKKHYREVNLSLVAHILAANPAIANPHLILVRQKITIPEVTEESLLVKTSGGRCQVLLGTYRRPEEALAYREESALRGKKIETIPRKISGRETWYHARAGEFASREEALKAIQALKKTGKLPIFAGRWSAAEKTETRPG